MGSAESSPRGAGAQHTAYKESKASKPMLIIEVNLFSYTTYAKIFGVPDLLNNENNLIPNGADISVALWVCPTGAA